MSKNNNFIKIILITVSLFSVSYFSPIYAGQGDEDGKQSSSPSSSSLSSTASGSSSSSLSSSSSSTMSGSIVAAAGAAASGSSASSSSPSPSFSLLRFPAVVVAAAAAATADYTTEGFDSIPPPPPLTNKKKGKPFSPKSPSNSSSSGAASSFSVGSTPPTSMTHVLPLTSAIKSKIIRKSRSITAPIPLSFSISTEESQTLLLITKTSLPELQEVKEKVKRSKDIWDEEYYNRLRLNRFVRLLHSGANVNCTDKNKDTPIHFAAANGDVALCRLFIENRATVNNKNLHGETPLILAVSKGNISIGVCVALIAAVKNKAKIEARAAGKTEEAAEVEADNVVEEFVSVKDNTNKTALDYVISHLISMDYTTEAYTKCCLVAILFLSCLKTKYIAEVDITEVVSEERKNMLERDLYVFQDGLRIYLKEKKQLSDVDMSLFDTSLLLLRVTKVNIPDKLVIRYPINPPFFDAVCPSLCGLRSSSSTSTKSPSLDKASSSSISLGVTIVTSAAQ